MLFLLMSINKSVHLCGILYSSSPDSGGTAAQGGAGCLDVSGRHYYIGSDAPQGA